MTEGQSTQTLVDLQTEIKQVQGLLQRLLAIPWRERSPLFKTNLMEAVGDTCERLLDLLLAQSVLKPGIRAEFNRQVDEVIDEVVATWEEQARKAEAEREEAGLDY